ncbi:MAG: cytochrome c family protein [Pirellulales bacterium]|nr:cytochrome c family protein [Pirellulales bacterium]
MERRPIYLVRVLLAVAAAAALAALLLAGREGGDPRRGNASRLNNGDCRRCHTQVWDEWSKSLHAASWTSDVVQASFRHFGFDRKCESCHAPEPILATGLSAEPILRSTHRDSGVDCLSCHTLADGGVAAARDLEAPCRPQREPLLTDSRACGVCHVAIYRDWQATPYVSQGKTCQACHMRSSDHTVSHACTGSRDVGLIRSGVRMRTRLEQGSLRVAVTNHGTGHNFPGERHHRVLLLEAMQYNASGDVVAGRQVEIKGVTPFRGESSAERLRSGETWRHSFQLADDAARIRVRLLYKLFPWLPDREALIVAERTHSLPHGQPRQAGALP